MRWEGCDYLGSALIKVEVKDLNLGRTDMEKDQFIRDDWLLGCGSYNGNSRWYMVDQGIVLDQMNLLQ